MSGVVVALQTPGAAVGLDELGDRRVQGVQLEASGHVEAEQVAEDRIDDTAVACDDDATTGMLREELVGGGSDAGVELVGGFATGEDLDVGVAVPVGCAEALDVGVERDAVEVGPRIVLTKTRSPVEVGRCCVAERRLDDLRRLDGTGELAGQQHVGCDVAGFGDAIAEAFGLLAAQVAEAGT